MPHRPADTLKNRSFVGLIVAQFLAGFNDQAIHASSMFYALSTGILREDQAISLMPVLFYAPWAIFCTLAGYYADRYSKTSVLVFWKFSEIVISLVLIAGFYIGSLGNPLGPWLVMSCVFLMGSHAAFFAPAKYGAMPEILQPHVLSKGNGILESTTFLSAIFGTVAGGLLSFQFKGSEVWIGVIFLGLSLLGAVFSLIIERLPAANPERRFPAWLYRPIVDNLRVLFRSRPLALSALGIAFFIFMVAYMRQVMYMHGQTRNPPWNEFRVSLVVATVALGVGLGAPLAGNLSGGKIELGLVPIGCLGMMLCALFAGFLIEEDIALIAALVGIGFFSGFYMVPLYTLLQHRAPKTTKGDLIATSNFINVTGAMAASVLFFLLVRVGRTTEITPLVEQKDHVATGTIESFMRDDHGHIDGLVLKQANGSLRPVPRKALRPGTSKDVEFAEDGILSLVSGIKEGSEVTVSRYKIGDVRRFLVREAGSPLPPVYNNEVLPRYLFFGAALMTLLIFVLLTRKLPDFLTRTLFWWRSLGRVRVQAVGMQHLPPSGPVILATNCDSLERSLQVVSVTDRSTVLVLHENGQASRGLLSTMAHRSNMIRVETDAPAEWEKVRERARHVLRRGDLLGVTVAGAASPKGAESFLSELRREFEAPVVPVFCGPAHGAGEGRVRVVFGAPLNGSESVDDIRRGIDHLASVDGTTATVH
ncbi:MAG: MFS transporter [Gemmataceae bacterium]